MRVGMGSTRSTQSNLVSSSLSSPKSIRHQSSAAAAVKHEQFMNGSSSIYIEQMYESWQVSQGDVPILYVHRGDRDS